jgi:hypothetical protein
MPWYTGNIHCHSTNSDGDSSPTDVARAYRDAGFDFLAITDHNHHTRPTECALDDGKLLLVDGSEYTSHSAKIPTHVNGIGVSRALTPVNDRPTVVGALQAGVDQVREQGAFSMLNHPNWNWSFGADEIAAVRGAHAFEVWNGAPIANNGGAPGRDSTDQIWDKLLTAGVRIWGVASDDCHHFRQPRQADWEYPFAGWIAVESERLERDLIVRALIDGRFYASSGLKLRSYRAAREEIALEIMPWGNTVFWTTFIGSGGRVLDVQHGPSAVYRPRGNEGYVRARVDSAMGFKCWTQPLFLD